MLSRRMMKPGSSTAYATWDPNKKDTHITLSSVNLVATNGENVNNAVYATVGITSGKWYWEIVPAGTGSGSELIGVGNSHAATTHYSNYYIGQDADTWGYYWNGSKYNAGATSYGSTWTNGNIIGVAVDMTAGKIWWSKNNVWQASGDPANGTNAAYTNLTGTIYPAVSIYATGSMTARFGPSNLSYTPPTGFTAGIYG